MCVVPVTHNQKISLVLLLIKFLSWKRRAGKSLRRKSDRSSFILPNPSGWGIKTRAGIGQAILWILSDLFFKDSRDAWHIVRLVKGMGIGDF